MKRLRRDPLMLEIAAAIGAGRMALRLLRDDGAFCHGLTMDGGEIAVNPLPDTINTVVHEAIHRLRPAWSERTVLARTTKLIRQLTDEELETLYVLFMSCAKVKRPMRVTSKPTK